MTPGIIEAKTNYLKGSAFGTFQSVKTHTKLSSCEKKEKETCFVYVANSESFDLVGGVLVFNAAKEAIRQARIDQEATDKATNEARLIALRAELVAETATLKEVQEYLALEHEL